MRNAAALNDPEVPSKQETAGNDADSFDFILEDVSESADEAEENASSKSASPQEEQDETESDSVENSKAQKPGNARAESILKSRKDRLLLS